jgi:hypothetical protein
LIRGDDNLIRDSHSSKEMETRSTCCHLSLSLFSFGSDFHANFGSLFGFANVSWLGSQRKKVKRVHLNNSPVYEMLRLLEVAESRRVGGVVNATRYYHYEFFFFVLPAVVDFFCCWLFVKGSITFDNNATVHLLWSRGSKGEKN